ncbi:MAG: hypothetical protein KM312_05440 [Hydrogenibacillus schlegelii]|uniref:Uncharacterized protein n=1 Tax=Hydrogenibacillus schlegelii TaxID=1484 RepID=A0A947G9T8_HYDSH|nr:hypothetical protein [Hydrogenibacillus schlegelii]
MVLMARRPPKRPIRPVVGDHFVDPRTPETELFGEETALRPVAGVETQVPATKKVRRAKSVDIRDEAAFRQKKWRKKLKIP